MLNQESRIIVLDDDPTGIQTVHGCLILTRWDESDIRNALLDPCPFFYVLTNTRAYGRAAAGQIILEIMRNILKVNHDFGYSLLFISRSDSTLRSNFPAEIDAITRALNDHTDRKVDAVFLVPAFFEGARITRDDTHFIKERNTLIPTAETEFAQDSVLGYGTSYLPAYIEEKTAGQVKKERVKSISLEVLQHRQTAELAAFLSGLGNQTYIVVNAESYPDLDFFSTAVLGAIKAGKNFIFQSGASLAKSLAKVTDKPLLGHEIVRNSEYGLLLAGSYVNKTTSQLEKLLENSKVVGIEANVAEILAAFDKKLQNILNQIQLSWRLHNTPAVYTSRQEMAFASSEKRLAAGRTISGFLVELVRRISGPLSFLIAKGGITSHDILVEGLGIRKARVLGQILPGVPVIMTPEDCRFSNIPYIIFPGNVGNENSLAEVYKILTGI